MKDIYLDNSATTPLCAAARAKLLSVSEECWGNASSLHGFGLQAAHTLNAARHSVMRALGARDGQIVFTGSGSEANNLAIFGRAYAKERYRRGGARIITTMGEHASVTAPLARLRAEGYDVVEIPTRGGTLDMAALEAALTKNTILVTMMAVNNETGAAYDIPAVARAVKRLAPEAILHTDATQAFMKLPLSPKDGADLITVSAHKIEGPKGCGALWISPSVIKNKGIAAQLLGGGQEGGMRSGTENVAGCAAFGAACDFARENFATHTAKMRALQEYLIRHLSDDPAFAEIRLNLPPKTAPHILNLTLPRIKSETMLHFLSGEGIYVSSGSACSSHGRHASPPLLAFGLDEKEADCSIRISLSYRNTEEELERFLTVLARGLGSLVRIH